MPGKLVYRCFLLLCFAASNTTAQHPDQLSNATKNEVVHAVASQLQEHYVYADSAALMSNTVLQNLKKGKYRQITDPIIFAEQIQRDLRSVCDDKHLLLQYHPPQLRQSSAAQELRTPDPYQAIKEINFGFQRVEIRPGNIGYLNLQSFRADPVNGIETMKGALRFLEHTRALVIDLRYNGGGSQETATLLMGFLLNKRTLVERFYQRRNNEYTEYWTQPDSSFRKFWNKPVYILTSHRSFSCAEMLAYDLQVLKRATIVGERTAGGAHGQFETDLGQGFVMQVPYWRSINPVTGTNWERVGVLPDIVVPESDALSRAEEDIYSRWLADAVTEQERFNWNWQLELTRSLNEPMSSDSLLLKSYVGEYGERRLTWERGKLYYQREGRPKFELVPMSRLKLLPLNNSYFKVELMETPAGTRSRLRVYYQDGRVEEADKN